MQWLKDLLKALLPDKADEIDKNFPKDPPKPADPNDSDAPKPADPNDSDPPKPADPKDSDPPKPADPSMQALTDQIKTLTDTVASYKAEIDSLKNNAKQTRQEKIDAVVQKAIDDNKIPAKNDKLIARYKKILEGDFEGGKEIIDNLPKLHEGKSDGEPPKQYKQKTPLDGADADILGKIKEYNKSAAAGDE